MGNQILWLRGRRWGCYLFILHVVVEVRSITGLYDFTRAVGLVMRMTSNLYRQTEHESPKNRFGDTDF